MVQRVQVVLVDDLDGGKADETVPFEWDGKAYEIDLSAEHARELRAAVGEFVRCARKVPRVVRGEGVYPGEVKAFYREVREFAGRFGVPLNPRGHPRGQVQREFREWVAAGRPAVWEASAEVMAYEPAG